MNSIQRSALSPTGSYYESLQPPILETLILPNAERGNSATVGGGELSGGDSNLRIMTFASSLAFKQACQFYADRLLPEGTELKATGVTGNFEKQSAYDIDEQSDLSVATFCQQTSTYSTSVYLYQSATDKKTRVTLLHGQK